MIQHKVEATSAAGTGLADRLKARTEDLHRVAERSGILRDILRGRASLPSYILLLRNLLPVYEALESELGGLIASSPARPLARPEVYRSAALRSDLDRLAGPGWSDAVPLLASARFYAEQITRAGVRDGDRLIAHAYVRYLGDLNGGQILKRLLGKQFGLGPDSLGFYDFPALTDLRTFAADYRTAIDHAALSAAAADMVLDEAVTAFRLNIDLSDAIAQRCLSPSQLEPADFAPAPV